MGRVHGGGGGEKGRHGRVAEDVVWGMEEDAALEREKERNKERK